MPSSAPRTWTALGLAVAMAVAGCSTSTPPESSSPSEDLSSSESTPAAAAPTAAPVPDPSLAQDRSWQARLSTDQGDLNLSLDGAAAPQAVANFVSLARQGYYDDTACHRLTVSGIFVLQCGDPTGTGTGDPGYSFGPIENAPPDEEYPPGTVAMARMGNDPDSQGSQFFLVYESSNIPADAAGGYTVFGHVSEGLDVVRAIADGGVVDQGVAPARPITIKEVSVQ